MKLLLTSAGIKNTSIKNALTGLLGKPISECNALCVPTALHAMSRGVTNAWKFVSGQESRTPLVELGWKSLGLLELAALKSVGTDHWKSRVREADVILVGGGDPLFLNYWMRESGFADLIPSLTNTVYVGISAGSMIMAPRIGDDFVNWTPPTGGDATLGIVDFAMFPHLDHPDLPENTMADAERWAAGIPLTTYAVDDDTAIQVVDGKIEVISEGKWKRFAR